MSLEILSGSERIIKEYKQTDRQTTCQRKPSQTAIAMWPLMGRVMMQKPYPKVKLDSPGEERWASLSSGPAHSPHMSVVNSSRG